MIAIILIFERYAPLTSLRHIRYTDAHFSGHMTWKSSFSLNSMHAESLPRTVNMAKPPKILVNHVTTQMAMVSLNVCWIVDWSPTLVIFSTDRYCYWSCWRMPWRSVHHCSSSRRKTLVYRHLSIPKRDEKPLKLACNPKSKAENWPRDSSVHWSWSCPYRIEYLPRHHSVLRHGWSEWST